MLAPQPQRVRRDFSIAFSERFPGLGVSNNVTAIFIELTATASVQTAVDFATVAFTHGVEGIWLLPPSATETDSSTETKMTKSECLIQCFKAISKTCRGKWVGVRPTHVPISQQFNWLLKHCQGAGGLWIDNLKIGASTEDATKNKPTVDPAKGVWQSVTFARATGTWDGVYFGGITPSQFKRCETAEVNDNKTVVVGTSQDKSEKTQSDTKPTPLPNPNAAVLKELCVAATFLMDAIIITSPADVAPLRLRCLQDARPALVYAADTLDLDILSEVSPFVEAIILCQSSLSKLTSPNDLGKCLDELMNQPTDEELATVDVGDNDSASVGNGQADGVDGGDEKTPSYLEQVLKQLVRVGLSDKRVIFGRLSCVDRDLNLILRDCDEYGSPTATDAAASGIALVFRRHIGLTMIPGEHISTFAVENTT